jgi:hypothetical protein
MIGSPSVIAGLDPAIHLAWKNDGCPGSFPKTARRAFSPGMTTESFAKTTPKRITTVDNAMTPA